MAFIVTAVTKLNVGIASDSMRLLLLGWGTTIFTGFLQHVMSYREVWYHGDLPDGWRKKLFPRTELCLNYTAMTLHPIAMLFSVILTVVALWNAL